MGSGRRPVAGRAGFRAGPRPTSGPMSYATKEQLEQMKGMVYSLISRSGPIPRSEIWLALHDRVSHGYVDQSLKALLSEGRIRADKATLSTELSGPWKAKKVLTYQATVYSATGPARGRRKRPSG